MSAISLKSITGITSITTPAGVDNQLTLHTNNTTERFKIDEAGNVRVANTFDCVGVSTFRNNLFAQADLRIAGEIVHISDSDTRIQFPSNDTIAFKTANTERLRITSDGRIGINDSTPNDYELDILKRDAATDAQIRLYNNGTASSNDTIMRYQIGGTTANNYIYFGDSADTNVGQIRYSHTSNFLSITTNAAERLRITSTGDILTGALTSRSFENDSTNQTILEVTGGGSVGNYGVLNISGNTNSSTPVGRITFVNRENSAATSTSNAGSKALGYIDVYAETSDSNAGDDSGGYMRFATKPESGGSAERLRIKSDGTVFTVTQNKRFGIGQDPDATTMGATSGTWQVPEVDGQTIGSELRLGDINTNSTAVIRLASYGSGDNGTGGGAIMFTNTRNGSNSHHSDIAAIKGARESLGKGYLRFFTANQGANAERLRITSAGRVGIGEDDPESNHVLIRGSSTVATKSGHIMLTGDSATVGEGPQIVFSESGSGSSYAGGYVGFLRQGSNSIGDLVFGTRGIGGDVNTVPEERVRITADGRLGVNVSSFTSGTGKVNQMQIKAESGWGALGIGATTQGITFGWDGDRTAYDDIRIYNVDYDNAATYGIAGNNPTFIMTPTTAPGSGFGQQTVWLKSTGRGSGNNEMNLCVDGDVVIGGSGQENGVAISGYPGSKQHGTGVSKLTIQPDDRTTAFSASDGDTWHDVIIKQKGGAQTNAAGIAFQVADQNYHKNAGTGIAAVKNGTNSDYGSDLVFITRPQSAVAVERVRINSAGNMGVGVIDPKSKLHLGSTGDIRFGSQYGGFAHIMQQAQYAAGYTGTHWMFESNNMISWCFDGVLIVYGGGGSSYGSEVTKITIVYSRENGANNSGDMWRNGTTSYNIETLGHSQVGLNPGAGELTVTEDTAPDGAASTRSLFKLGWTQPGHGGATTIWSKLHGTFYWGQGVGYGSVEIQDKDGTIVWNSNP